MSDQHTFTLSGLQVAEIVGALAGGIETNIREINNATDPEERAAWVRHLERQSLLLDMFRSRIGGKLTQDVRDRLDGVQTKAAEKSQ